MNGNNDENNDGNNELCDNTIRDLETHINQLKKAIKRKEQLIIKAKKEEVKKAKTQAFLDDQPRRKAKRKLKDIKDKIRKVKANINKMEAKEEAYEEKVMEDLKPITEDGNIILKDVVDEILTTYTPAVKKAIYKYRSKNIKKYNDYAREYNTKKMNCPEYARRKREATARSNEKVRLRKLQEREALQKKIKIIKNEKPDPKLNTIILTEDDLE